MQYFVWFSQKHSCYHLRFIELESNLRIISGSQLDDQAFKAQIYGRSSNFPDQTWEAMHTFVYVDEYETLVKLAQRSVLIRHISVVYSSAPSFQELDMRQPIWTSPDPEWTHRLDFVFRGAKLKQAEKEEYFNGFPEDIESGPIHCLAPTQVNIVFRDLTQNPGQWWLARSLFNLSDFGRRTRAWVKDRPQSLVPNPGQTTLIQLITTPYSLSHRKVLGPTTCDPDLAAVMANLAMVHPNSITLDPFCGSAGLLVA